jgi:hypothetical protein
MPAGLVENDRARRDFFHHQVLAIALDNRGHGQIRWLHFQSS